MELKSKSGMVDRKFKSNPYEKSVIKSNKFQKESDVLSSPELMGRLWHKADPVTY